ncbi:hypothetical protein GJAV_G00267560 [Gymnothorax javanicus]|nr:hypothetical protein GJAV_G00267560 [Gymnothorax javanicus]
MEALSTGDWVNCNWQRRSEGSAEFEVKGDQWFLRTILRLAFSLGRISESERRISSQPLLWRLEEAESGRRAGSGTF